MFSLINPPGINPSARKGYPERVRRPRRILYYNKAEKRDTKRRPKFLYAHRYARNKQGEGRNCTIKYITYRLQFPYTIRTVSVRSITAGITMLIYICVRWSVLRPWNSRLVWIAKELAKSLSCFFFSFLIINASYYLVDDFLLFILLLAFFDLY